MGNSCYNISGNPAIVHSPAKTSIESMKIYFLPVQEGSGNPSPINIRNTNGLTSINAYQEGKNLINFDDLIQKDFANATTTANVRMNNMISVCPGAKMTFTSLVTSGRYVRFYDKDGNHQSDYNIAWYNVAESNTFTVPNDSYFLRLMWYNYGTTLSIEQVVASNPVLEYGEKYTGYQKYNERKTIPIEMKTIGKNLIHTKYPSRTATGITFTVNADQSITVNGTATATTWLCPALIDKPQYHTFLKAGTYFLSGGKSVNKAVYLAGRYVDGTSLSQSWDQGNGKLYTFSKDIWVYPQICIAKDETVNNETFYIQLEQGSSATEYEPYCETERTIYGGYIDPAEGKIVAEYIKITPTKEEFTSQYSSGIGYRQTAPQYSPTASGVIWKTARQQQTCNKAMIANPYSESAETYGEYMGVVFTMEASPTVAYARVSEALYQTLEEGETVEFTYKLINPITYNIPKQQLNTLLGTSTYWSEALQNVDISYKVIDSADMISARKRVISHAPHTVVNDEQSLSKVITFNTDIKGNLSSCITSFTPSQSGTETPATDNIMPIIPCKEIKVKHTGRAVAQLAGYSCSAMTVQAPGAFKTSGNYGTTIDVLVPTIDSDAVVITQSSWGKPETKSSYQNGYICIGFYDLEYERTYNISFDVTNIISNPLEASLSNLALGGPNGLGQTGPYAINGNRVTFRLNYRQYANVPKSYGMEFRTCGMSFTLSNVIITDENETDWSYEPYINPCGKNKALIYGYGATGMSTGGVLSRTNSYGTTLSTTAYTLPDLPVVITQSNYDTTISKNSFKNGYLNVITPQLQFDKTYTVSFKVTDITNNPLEATLSDFRLIDPGGYGSGAPTVIGNRVIFNNFIHRRYNGRCGLDIHFCGMSCTISEIMVTETDDDATTFEPYNGNPHTIILPPLGKNLFPCRESEMTESGWYRYFPNCLKESGTYTISCQSLFGGTGNLGCRVSMSDSPENGGTMIGDPLTGWGFATSDAGKVYTFTLTAEQAKAPYIRFEMLSSHSTYADIAGGQIQIEKGSTATSFEMYQEQVCGKLDVITGKFIAEWEYHAARWGDIKNGSPHSTTGLQWGYLSFNNNVYDAHYQSNYGTKTLCNCCGTISWSQRDTTPEHYYITDNIAYMVLPSTLDDDTIIEVAAKLQSPITIQLTPIQIKTLQGYNALKSNVEMDSVKYWTH